MLFRLANGAAIERSWRLDLMNCLKKLLKRLATPVHFPFAAPRSGSRNYRGVLCEHGHVFDKGRIRMLEIGFEPHDSKPATLERRAIRVVLSERVFVIGWRAFERRQSVGEILARSPHDGVLEQRFPPRPRRSTDSGAAKWIIRLPSPQPAETSS